MNDGLLALGDQINHQPASPLSTLNAQYSMVLDFSRTVHEDLGNFDENGAWPWLLDEFVEHLRRQKSGNGASSSSGSALLYHQWRTGGGGPLSSSGLRPPAMAMLDACGSGEMAEPSPSSGGTRTAVSPRCGR